MVWDKSVVFFIVLLVIKMPSNDLFGNVVAHDITYFLKVNDSNRDHFGRFIYLFIFILSDIWHKYKSMQYKNKSHSDKNKHSGSVVVRVARHEIKWVENWNETRFVPDAYCDEQTNGRMVACPQCAGHVTIQFDIVGRCNRRTDVWSCVHSAPWHVTIQFDIIGRCNKKGQRRSWHMAKCNKL